MTDTPAEQRNFGLVGLSKARFAVLITVFLGPALAIYTLFAVYPLIATIAYAMYHVAPDGSSRFAGLDNFRTLLFDDTWSKPFWNAFRNNSWFFLIHMLVQNPIGLLLAALLSQSKLTGRAAYRTLIFMPTMLSVVIIGFIWQLILSPLWGVSKSFLAAIGMQSWFAPWLGLESSALITISLMSVWQFVGIPMILIYTALIAIPEDFIDAARVDGLNARQIFTHIKLPLIAPTIGLVSVLTFVNNFNAFDLIYAVKGAIAGPNFATDIMGTFFYRTFFGHQLQLGDRTMGSAVATMMFLIILAGLMIYLVLIQRRLQRYSY